MEGRARQGLRLGASSGRTCPESEAVSLVGGDGVPVARVLCTCPASPTSCVPWAWTCPGSRGSGGLVSSLLTFGRVGHKWDVRQVPRVAHPLPPQGNQPPSGSVKATSGAAAAGGGNPGGGGGGGAQVQDIGICVPGITVSTSRNKRTSDIGPQTHLPS